MLKRMQQGGEDELPVLRDFAMRSGLADIADFVNVYEICRASGGDLARAMNRAATIIGDKIQLEAELKTMMAQKAFESRIVAAAPFAMVLLMRVTTPAYLQVMYETRSGPDHHDLCRTAHCLRVLDDGKGSIKLRSKNKKLQEKQQTEILYALPGFLNQLLLLTGSGMVLADALQRIADGYELLPQKEKNYFTESFVKLRQDTARTGESLLTAFRRFSRFSHVKELNRRDRDSGRKSE